MGKDSKVDSINKFESLLEFLLEEKRVINYESADLRSSSGSMKCGDGFYVENGGVSTDDENKNDRKLVDHRRFQCLIHSTNHKTAECREYIAMKPEERVNLLREKRGCWSCLMNGHLSIDCYHHRVKCKENGCEKFHHTSLHEAHTKGVAFHASSDVHNSALLQLMRVPSQDFDDKNELLRPTGKVDVLIGYSYARFHPSRMHAVGNLLLLSNQFGKCLGGSHPSLVDRSRRVINNVAVHHVRGGGGGGD